MNQEQRKHYALELEANPILQELLSDLCEGALTSWDNTTIDQTEKREEAWRMRQTVKVFSVELRNKITEITKEESR